MISMIASIQADRLRSRIRRAARAGFLFLLLFFISPTASAQEPETNPFAAASDYAQARCVKIYGATIGRLEGYASGVIVSSEGEILTQSGVFLAASRIRVTLADGSTHVAKVVRRSRELHLALLKIEVPTPQFFEVPKQSPAEQGDWVLAVSNAFKVADGPEPLSVTLGILSTRTKIDAKRGATDIPYEGEVWLLDTVTSNPGAAGGAVVTTEGKLVGLVGKILESKRTGTRINYAVPSDVLHGFLNEQESQPAAVAEGENIDRGIRVFTLGGTRAPAYIEKVTPGSPAAAAGLKSDDLIVSVDGQQIRSAGQFQQWLRAPSAKNVVITVKRGTQLLDLELKTE